MRPTAALTPLAALVLASSSPHRLRRGPGSDPDTVQVSFKQSTDTSVKAMDTCLTDMGKQFEKAHVAIARSADVQDARRPPGRARCAAGRGHP
ncbi:hypothetical protein [Streptomyces sp. NPDC092370]|uniref:hypothetical protein n=1 Tax=Streptomyces sp. NPDC092370 TaxID=3366016 RepID=UPI003800A6B0